VEDIKAVEDLHTSEKEKTVQKEYPEGENYALTTSRDLMKKLNFIAEDEAKKDV
jgi:hypothetical protein